jgi:hypothetical protein
VLPFIVLGVGLICALISRILLFMAASRISVGWTIGIFLPFGPLFFRLNYPDEARRSLIFRVLTVLCLFYFLTSGPGLNVAYYKRRNTHPTRPPKDQPAGYAMEKPVTPAKPAASPTGIERRAASEKEFERLAKWNEQLRLRKRDLLRSDTQGNRVYVVDLALYNDALAKANAEKAAFENAK